MMAAVAVHVDLVDACTLKELQLMEVVVVVVEIPLLVDTQVD